MTVPPRRRETVSRRFPVDRLLVIAAVRAGRRIQPMHGLVTVDVTDARARLARRDPPLSLTAFLVASVGRSAARHPGVHAYRDWRGRLVEHRHVDVQTLVEIPTPDGPFGLVHVVRDADVRPVEDVTTELRRVKQRPASTTNGRLLARAAPVAGRVPGLYRLMFAVMRRSRRVRAATGTVQVTAVGMFGGGAGFAIAPPTLASCTIVVGGLDRRPCVRDGHVVVRDLTVAIDYAVNDGAPATRFVADLRRTTDLSGANLRGAVLRRCDLTNAAMGDVVLERCDLRGSEIGAVDPWHAELAGAIITWEQAAVLAAAMGLDVRPDWRERGGDAKGGPPLPKRPTPG